MSRFPQPEQRLAHTGQGRFSWRRARVVLIALAMSATLQAQADAAGARRAIESLEACSEKERAQGCVKILKRKSLGDNKHAIKAQVRGGRIIWYEYNGTTGSVKRTN